MSQITPKQTTRPTTSSPRASATARQPGQHGESLKLDAVIHERVRLAIVSALAVNDALSFNDLKKLLEITDGNLSVHARKLEDAGYVKCTKSFVGRQPRTEFRLTASGRRALEGYLVQMESVIRSARKE
ncbi:MAG TPA: transcriptional regulator [Terracidiphilus sp.]|nr:transcriptional regulator [Terracidiphilus sp.]